jgi:hypothetical protein
MLKSFMFASLPTYPSNRPRRLHLPDPNLSHPDSNYCHPERSEGSAFLSLVAHRHLPLAAVPLTPFLATLTVPSQLPENPATLSPVLATLTRRVKPNPFVCHSYTKHPGVGVPRQIFPLSHSAIFSVNSALSVPSALNSLPPICIASTVANSRRIRTYVKHTRNPFRIRTSKTQDLKPFRMNTYKKPGRGPAPKTIATRHLSVRYVVTSLRHYFIPLQAEEPPSPIARTTTRNR